LLWKTNLPIAAWHTVLMLRSSVRVTDVVRSFGGKRCRHGTL